MGSTFAYRKFRPCIVLEDNCLYENMQWATLALATCLLAVTAKSTSASPALAYGMIVIITCAIGFAFAIIVSDLRDEHRAWASLKTIVTVARCFSGTAVALRLSKFGSPIASAGRRFSHLSPLPGQIIPRMFLPTESRDSGVTRSSSSSSSDNATSS